MKTYLTILFFGLLTVSLFGQSSYGKQSNKAQELSAQETISSQVQNIKMLIDIENMIAEINSTDEEELIKANLKLDARSVIEKFKKLQTLRQAQIEYLESKESEIDALLLKFNEIERKSQLASN